MTFATFDDDDTYRPKLPHLWERTPSHAPTPAFFGRQCTPSVFCPSPAPEEVLDERLSPPHQTQSSELGFLQVVEQEDGEIQDGQPSCINYLIEWKVTLNNRVVA